MIGIKDRIARCRNLPISTQTVDVAAMLRTALSSLLAKLRPSRPRGDRPAHMADDLDSEPRISVLMHIRGFLSLVRQIVLARNSAPGRTPRKQDHSGGRTSDGPPAPRRRE